MTSPSQSGVTIAVHAASNAIVGSYRLAASLLTKNEQKQDVKCVERVAEEFLLIFNPWCKGWPLIILSRFMWFYSVAVKTTTRAYLEPCARVWRNTAVDACVSAV